MIAIAGMILGGVIGWFRASRRGGATLDKLQWAGAHLVLGAVVGLFLTILAERML
jgi:hypothetical protein